MASTGRQTASKLLKSLDGSIINGSHLTFTRLAVPRSTAAPTRLFSVTSISRTATRSGLHQPSTAEEYYTQRTKTRHGYGKAGAVAAALVTSSLLYLYSGSPLHADAQHRPSRVDDAKGAAQATSQSVEKSNRYIRLEELKRHGKGSEDGSLWVSRGTGVYDITEFVENHPGGTVIMRAAGGALEPYWSVFSFHARPDILDILEELRIGDVDPKDLVDGKVPASAIEDPFEGDPARDERLIQRTQKPCNAETPMESLQPYITTNETFFTRNHLWVPKSEPDKWEVTVELPDGSTKSYLLPELKKKFKECTITATLQCSGNRRSHMTANSRSTNGLQWDAGAISNAEWTGVRLRDVLKDAGLPVDDLPDYAKHAQFYGNEGYGASIPIDKACDRRGDVLLAYEMNGKPLPADHGAPLRVLVPGNVAARSVKWVSRVIIADEESTSQWQRRDYKCFGPNVGSNPNWEKAKAIQETPVQSAITSIEEFSSHTDDERTLLRNYGLEEDFVKIAGYAYSGGGRAIQRVDVSVDGGVSWRQGTLEPNEAKGSKAWAWTKWTHVVPRGYVGREIVVKAVDDAYNTQPEEAHPIWNLRGNLTTSWHRIPKPNFKS